jgi:hypothetical protein
MSTSNLNAGRPGTGKCEDPTALLRELEAVLRQLHAAVAVRDLEAIARHTAKAGELLPQVKRLFEKPSSMPARQQVRAVHAAAYNASVMVKKAKTTVQALMAVYRSVPGPIPEVFQEQVFQEQP